MTKEVFEQIQEGLSEALTVARREKAIVTDEMVDAFGQKFWSVNAASKIDGQREEIRAALTAALSQAETQPVGYVTGTALAHLQEDYSTSIYPPTDDYAGMIPLFASPVPAKREAGDYFGELVAKARQAAEKATRKFPQPNYVTLKIAEEAGEVVRGAVHYAEGRMPWDEVEGEIVQLIAMLIRFVTEGDEINGIKPPALSTSSTPADGEDRAAPVANLQGLTTFAKAMIQVAFQGGDISGADIQGLGVQHGLLSCVPFDPEKHKDPEGYAEEGDYWYVYAGPLATTEAAE